MGDKAVPVFSGGDAEDIAFLLDSFQSDAQHKSRKALVGDKEVAASSENKERQAVDASEFDASRISASLVASTNQRAGPPMWKVV